MTATMPVGEFKRRLLRALCVIAAAQASSHIPSKTLRRALRYVIASNKRAYLYIPHYWALYVHDGRLPFSMPPGKYLVWFRNPALDPRLKGGQTPERANRLLHLSPAEFKSWLEKNKEARAQGLPPPMIVVRQIHKATRGTFFFDNNVGMKGYAAKASKAVGPFVRGYMLSQVADLMNIKDRAVAYLKI